jgi:hypothetical protein
VDVRQPLLEDRRIPDDTDLLDGHQSRSDHFLQTARSAEADLPGQRR